jgi:hypothetical protein
VTLSALRHTEFGEIYDACVDEVPQVMEMVRCAVNGLIFVEYDCRNVFD